MSAQNDQQQQTKRRWGGLEEERGGEYSGFQLEPKQIFGLDDDNNVGKFINYKFSEDDDTKITANRRIRELVQTHLREKAYERSWPKVGDAVRGVGGRLTTVSTEEILFKRPTPLGAKQEDAKAASNYPFEEGSAVVFCRPCGTDGPTQPDGPDQPDGSSAGEERPLVDMRRRNEEHSVRVSNLSENTREQHLNELFMPFGHISRVYVAMDCRTGRSRGIGFVNFANMEDAERAISELNGYSHDNLTLRVEWAMPRVNQRLPRVNNS